MRLGHLTRLIAALATTVVVAGCASDDSGSAGSQAGTSSVAGAAPSSAASEAALSVADAWIKAIPGGGGMTAVFAKLTNETGADLTVESATTTISDVTELHHMVMKDGSMVMEPIEGGIPVPAGETVELKPGGMHIMALDVAEAVAAGDTHTVTLTLSNGEELTFEAVAKDFAGGNEKYEGSGSASPGA